MRGPSIYQERATGLRAALGLLWAAWLLWGRRPRTGPHVVWYLDAQTYGGTVGCERLLAVVPHASPRCGCGYLAVEFPDTGKPRLGEWVSRAEVCYPEILGAQRVSDRFAEANAPGLYGFVERLLRAG